MVRGLRFPESNADPLPLALTLAHPSRPLVIAARRLAPLEKTQKEIQALGGKCDVYSPLNIKEEESCYACIKEVVKRHGRLDGLGWFSTVM